MLRDKAAIGDFDRVALCPPAGHLTSSYWVALGATVRSEETEIRMKRRICRFWTRPWERSWFSRPATSRTAVVDPEATQTGAVGSKRFMSSV
jgi:hypothetical protein